MAGPKPLDETQHNRTKAPEGRQERSMADIVCLYHTDHDGECSAAIALRDPYYQQCDCKAIAKKENTELNAKQCAYCIENDEKTAEF